MSRRRVAAIANAKVNVSLYVAPPRADGLHPLRGIFQSIDWHDALTIDPDREPGISGPEGRPVIDGEDNLAWRASRWVADAAGCDVAVVLDKRIAVAAGLGGGSADAAAALAATALACGGSPVGAARHAASLGSDVPFCLVGGAAVVTGAGERVTPLATPADHVLAIVVPPVEVSTPAVFARWDAMEGPTGPVVADGDLPPSLRGRDPVRNDLTDAAIAVAPAVAEWRGLLSERWGRPVLVSGSGPALFGFFHDADEAADALAVVPVGARDSRVARPVDHGWAVDFDGAGSHRDLRPVDDDRWFAISDRQVLADALTGI